MFKAFSRNLLCSHSLFSSKSNAKTPFHLTFSSMSAAVKQVGTHNGSFHCDEALGCFMIRLTKKFSDARIVRTRDAQVLESLDAVLDVGGVYDPTKHRYDHHQKGFEEVFGHGFDTKLSSAGLVYKHFGKEIIAKELQVDEDHPDVHRLFLAVYKSFMEDDRSKSWRIQAVGIAPDRFESRKALPVQWRGLRDEELSKETRVPGGVFVHMSGFIGGNQTFEGALAMAKAALKL